MIIILSLLFTHTFCVQGRQFSDNPIVMTNNGVLKGVTQMSVTGKKVDAWYSIPYALPPTGRLRFIYPKPVQRWKGVLDASPLPNSCFQLNTTFLGNFEGLSDSNANTQMSEDCLYLSVIVPRPRPKNAAVIMWLHGGHFSRGTVTNTDYKTLVAEQNIILVAPQYRTGSLGFLYMGTPSAPGNAGLFDQLLAMKWINSNIEHFGGDRQKVTLLGAAAGATSASMHLLSPLSRNLFKRAIVQSGSATVPWGFVTKGKALRRGFHVAKAVGCPHGKENIEEIMECLRSTHPLQMISNDPILKISNGFPFVPVLDDYFFPQMPNDILESGNFKNTEILLGTNANEGFILLMYVLPDLFPLREDVEVSRPEFEKAVKYLFPNLNSTIQEAIIFEYTNWSNPDDEIINRDALDKIVGDYYFTCSVDELADYYAESGLPVYKYEFNHRSSLHQLPNWTHVIHGDEVPFVFGEPLDPEKNFTDVEILLSKRIMSYWANFAKTGNPNLGEDDQILLPEWPVYNSTDREYLELEIDSPFIGTGPRINQCAFWNKFIAGVV